jgi:hypothetical protein
MANSSNFAASTYSALRRAAVGAMFRGAWLTIPKFRPKFREKFRKVA